MRCMYTDGTLVLNAPVGSKEFCEASFTARVRSLEPLLDDVAALEDSHVSFTRLKFCLGVDKIHYLLRVTPDYSTASGVALFDNRSKNACGESWETHKTPRSSMNYSSQ